MTFARRINLSFVTILFPVVARGSMRSLKNRIAAVEDSLVHIVVSPDDKTSGARRRTGFFVGDGSLVSDRLPCLLHGPLNQVEKKGGTIRC